MNRISCFCAIIDNKPPPTIITNSGFSAKKSLLKEQTDYYYSKEAKYDTINDYLSVIMLSTLYVGR